MSGYTHEDLWQLAWKWWEIADNRTTEPRVRLAYGNCADQLTELIGPLAYAAVPPAPLPEGTK